MVCIVFGVFLMCWILEQSIRKVYEWLSPADVEVNHAVASKLRHSHTGEWFLGGEEFRGWLTGNYKFLWLYAIRKFSGQSTNSVDCPFKLLTHLSSNSGCGQDYIVINHRELS